MRATADMVRMRAEGKSCSVIAASLGVAKSTVQRALAGQPRAHPAKPNAKPAEAKRPAEAPPSRTLADFRKEHDQTWKIRDGLRRLFAGQVIMTDAEFREAVSGNPSRWRAAADQTEFKENRYRVGGELLWAGKETIREMRKIRGEAI